MKKILTFIFTIFLSLSFQVQSVEIEIITDKPGTGKRLYNIHGFNLNTLARLKMEKFLIQILVRIDL